MEFNASEPRIIHLDINSCFATIEQQANPILRDKAVVVCAYTTNSGTILAASVTAKKLGMKTGMRVKDAKLIYPKVIILEPDPPKYRFVHNAILKILKDYSFDVTPKSIDEFVFTLHRKVTPYGAGVEIKKRIKKEIGDYITVSIGVSTNRYLAKVASGLQKPDGYVLLNKNNINEVFSKMKLTDLTGIKRGNSARLNVYGIKTVQEFYDAPVWKLKLAFGGIGGLYWHQRLHGYEIDGFKSLRKIYGNSFAPPPNKKDEVDQILSKLAQKTGFRLRKAKLKASGMHLFLQDRDGFSWHMGRSLERDIFDSNDIFNEMKKLLKFSPIKNNLRNIAISTFNLKSIKNLQLEIFDNITKKKNLNNSIDSINQRYGDYTIYPARMVKTEDIVKDRIAFGQ